MACTGCANDRARLAEGIKDRDPVKVVHATYVGIKHMLLGHETAGLSGKPVSPAKK